MRQMSAAFLILAIMTMVAACAAMTLRSLVHCALALAVAFAGIGTLYLTLGAQFLGLAQLLVYVGAIAVLIVFVILLTRGVETESGLTRSRGLPLSGFVIALSLLALLGWAVSHSFVAHSAQAPAGGVSVRSLG